jgi:hypothetical protein
MWLMQDRSEPIWTCGFANEIKTRARPVNQQFLLTRRTETPLNKS